MTIARFEALLDIHGAKREAWPAAERAEADALLQQSPEARELYDEARRLDRLLDAVRCEPPSSILLAQVIASAPRRPIRSRWQRFSLAAVPLAAAAALVLWLVVADQNEVQVATAPESIESDVGDYLSATDVLLDPMGVDVYSTAPSFECDSPALGCESIGEEEEDSYSQRPEIRRSMV